MKSPNLPKDLPPAAFLPALDGWQPPTPQQLAQTIAALGYGGEGQPGPNTLARRCGLGKNGYRAIDGWLDGERPIQYQVWFTLVELHCPEMMKRLSDG